MLVLLIYIALFVGAFFAVQFVRRGLEARQDFTSLKTVTFGDESAVTPDRTASIISVVAVFVIWGAFTNSALVPFHMPGPFTGTTEFTYTAQNAAGETDEATVTVEVFPVGQEADAPEIEPGDGFAANDSDAVQQWRSTLVRIKRNDEGGDADAYRVIAVDGAPIDFGERARVAAGRVTLTEPLYLPSPEAVVARRWEIASEGYQNTPLWEHLGMSLFRVVAGFFFGALIGIPLGYAMGLSGWFRGWFDPIVEFMRPVPPLALIPLVIIWFGIDEQGKVVLLFLAALWIMTIGARAGVSGVNISKIHAAYSLGASKWQILRYVIVPNSLPEIFTAARVAMGVCWGTVVAAELVAAQEGAGMMIIAASRFQLTDIVILGIVLIGIIGYGIDILMRMAENYLVPWKGRS